MHLGRVQARLTATNPQKLSCTAHLCKGPKAALTHPIHCEPSGMHPEPRHLRQFRKVLGHNPRSGDVCRAVPNRRTPRARAIPPDCSLNTNPCIPQYPTGNKRSPESCLLPRGYPRQARATCRPEFPIPCLVEFAMSTRAPSRTQNFDLPTPHDMCVAAATNAFVAYSCASSSLSSCQEP